LRFLPDAFDSRRRVFSQKIAPGVLVHALLPDPFWDLRADLLAVSAKDLDAGLSV
jgi:hypothetical protein